MTKSTITRERLLAIADDNSWVKCTHDEVQELARMVLAALDSEPVADVVRWSHPTEGRTCDIRWRRHDVEPGPLYRHAQPLVSEQPAPLYVEPITVTDDMAYAFHHALTDGPIGADDVEEIKDGLRAAFANVAAPQPAPVVPGEIDAIISKAVNGVMSTYSDSAEECRFMVREHISQACRAAMLNGDKS